MVTQPELLDDSRYPEDVKERAKTILKGCRGASVGNHQFNLKIILYYVRIIIFNLLLFDQITIMTSYLLFKE